MEHETVSLNVKHIMSEGEEIEQSTIAKGNYNDHPDAIFDKYEQERDNNRLDTFLASAPICPNCMAVLDQDLVNVSGDGRVFCSLCDTYIGDE